MPILLITIVLSGLGFGLVLPGMPFVADWLSDSRFVVIRVQLPRGVLHVNAPRKRLYAGTIYIFVVWIVGMATVLFGIAALFMRNQVRAFTSVQTAQGENSPLTGRLPNAMTASRRS